MQTTANRMLFLAGLASLSLVSGCETRAPTLQRFPPAQDLAVEPKPLLSPEALTSEKALNDHEADVEAWGERGWAAVARLCRWSVQMGAKGLNCPK